MRFVRSRLWMLLVSLFGAPMASSAPLQIGSDWQLPYVETNEFRAFADTSGTIIEYSDGESIELHAGSRGFPPVYQAPLLFATSLDGRVSAWHLEERRLIWQRQFEGWLFPPLVRRDVIFLAGQSHQLFKLDLTSGATLASVPLPNEAIYSPLSWLEGGIAVSVYARTFLILESETLSEKNRYLLPAPAITASPYGYYLIQNGDLYQRRDNGEFDLRHTGESQVRWHQVSDDGLYWAGDLHFLRLWENHLTCLNVGVQVVHRQQNHNKKRITVRDPDGTYRTLRLLQDWGNLNQETVKENNNEKMAGSHDIAADRFYDQLSPC